MKDVDIEFEKLLELSLNELIPAMGWDMAMPVGGGPEDDGLLKGLIIGESDYVNYVLKCMEK